MGRSRLAVTLLLIGIGLVLGASAYWFLFGESLQRADPVRLVAGALLIFLLPGLVLGELLRVRGRSPLETIALAAAASLTLEIGLVAVVFLLAASIQLWVGLLLALTALGV